MAEQELADENPDVRMDGQVAVPSTALEIAAQTPEPIESAWFNPGADLPYGLTTDHIQRAMREFVDFLGFMNQRLGTRDIQRFESMLMPANFSSMVGEFMSAGIPKNCPSLVKNRFHNGHPDLIPSGVFPNDAVRHAKHAGIEIKSSRYVRGWQGHNREDTWLMVFVFDSNRPDDVARGVAPKPFRFVMVAGAQLVEDDWKFSGRKGTSRRTPTAHVTPTGHQKMTANWIYRNPALILNAPRRQGSNAP